MRLTEEREPVQRLYDRLTAALRTSRSEPFASPVTVAEIYQELVPYRTVRGELGFSMNADYEHALLRLLGGEGELVQLEPSSARDVIQRELRSPNPNVSIYREYAGCDAWVRPAEGVDGYAAEHGDDDDSAVAWLDDVADDADDASSGPAAHGSGNPGGGRSTGASLFALAEPEAEDRKRDEAAQGVYAGPAATPVTGSPRAGQAAPPAGRAPAQAAAPAPVPGGARCVFCDSGLPQKRPVRFCPYCGGDQQMRPCSACGEALEAGWSFCVACGVEAHGG